MLTFRAYKPEDHPEAMALLPPGAAEPQWNTVVVLEVDGHVAGFAAVRQRTQIEPLAAKNGFSAAMLACWLDGRLADTPEYEAFVLDTNPEFQMYLQKHFPVEEITPGKGKWFVRRR